MTGDVAAKGDYYGPTPCSLANTLMIVGERWTFLVLREAMAGATRFTEFRSALGITAEVLNIRLRTLVDAGVMIRDSYQEPGQRVRASYVLSDAGRQLIVVLGALQQWGDEHAPSTADPAVAFETAGGQPVSVSFVDRTGSVVPEEDIRLRRTPFHPLH